MACYTDSFIHGQTQQPLPYLCASSFGVCLQAVGSLHLQEHLYARGSPKVHMYKVRFEMVEPGLRQHAALAG